MQRNAGFTLVELLVVIAIIATLAGLLVPSLLGTRWRAQRTFCLNNLKELGRLAVMYADDRRGVFPKAADENAPAYRSLQLILDANPGTPSKLFVCPSSEDERAQPDEDGRIELDPQTSSYAWISEKTKTTSFPSLPLASDDSFRIDAEGRRGNHPGGVNVVYVGMNAEWLPAEELPEGRLFPLGLVDNDGRR